jgi:hypothetical protein
VGQFERERARRKEKKANPRPEPDLGRFVELTCFRCGRLLGRFLTAKSAKEAGIKCRCGAENLGGKKPVTKLPGLFDSRR